MDWQTYGDTDQILSRIVGFRLVGRSAQTLVFRGNILEDLRVSELLVLIVVVQVPKDILDMLRDLSHDLDDKSREKCCVFGWRKRAIFKVRPDDHQVKHD